MSTTGEEGKLITSEAPSPLRSRHSKLLVGTFAVLCVAAAIAACAALLSAQRGSSAPHQQSGVRHHTQREDSDMREVLNDHEVFQRSPEGDNDAYHDDEEEKGDESSPKQRVPRVATEPTARANCYSDEGLDMVPAAHIGGANTRWTRDPLTAVYKTYWDCESYSHDSAADAYVHGGMCFLQSDNSLYVPKCGYYYIYSQILFKVHASDSAKSVLHQLKFQRNCSSSDTHETTLMTFESVAAHTNATVTTHTSDIVKLCRGGRVWVNIPEGEGRSACCPKGGIHAFGSSYFGAILVSEDDCHWPPKITLEM